MTQIRKTHNKTIRITGCLSRSIAAIVQFYAGRDEYMVALANDTRPKYHSQWDATICANGECYTDTLIVDSMDTVSLVARY